MTRYQLAKLIALAGVLPNRKRVQKIVHLLKAAGCPFDADYRLHHYGPYSDEVAGLLNQLVQQGLLIEEELPAPGSGRQFKYHLSEPAVIALAEFEKSPEGAAAAAELEPHEVLFKELLKTELGRLELASTIVFNRQAGKDWDAAVGETSSFKHVPRNAVALIQAERLAKKIVT